MGGGRGGDLGGHGRHVAGVDHAGAALARRGAEAACPGDGGGECQDVLHVGVGPQQRVGQSGGGQAGLDLGLPAPPGDRRVGGCLAGGLDDVPDAGPGGAGDNVQLLRGHGRADQDDRGDARQRHVDACRDVEVTDGDLDARVGQCLGLARVAHQYSDGQFPLPEQERCFGADLACGCHEDHGVALSARKWVTAPTLLTLNWVVKPRKLICWLP